MKLLNILLVGLLASLSQYAVSANPDQSQPIYIESDKARRDDPKGITIYEGKVEVTQGSLLLKADKVTLYNTQKDGITTLIANGRPAHYQQKPAPDKTLVKARAKTIKYSVSKEHILLTDDAWLTQDGATFDAAIIEYDIAKAIVEAKGKVKSSADSSDSSDNKHERIRVVIPPQVPSK